MVEALKHIRDMAPYQLADLACDAKRVISMAQNESLRPPSPAVANAILTSHLQSHLYPDPDWQELRNTISGIHGVPAELILCGTGSMELIACICQTYLDSGGSAVTTQYAYAFFQTAARLVNANIVAAPESRFSISVDAILNRCKNDTRVVFIANPGNPTGTAVSNSEIRKLRKELPEDVLLVVDEAYGEFAADQGDPLFDLCTLGNTAIIRTFSKAYGLAGMRVGWGVFPLDVVGQMRKTLNPNNINLVGQVAAIAAMQDQSYMLETCGLTATLRDRLRIKLSSIGLETPESQTNFLLIPFQNQEDATTTNRFLLSQGIIMRPMGGYDLPNCLRATIVGEQDMNFVEQAIDLMLDRGNISHG